MDHISLNDSFSPAKVSNDGIASSTVHESGIDSQGGTKPGEKKMPPKRSEGGVFHHARRSPPVPWRKAPPCQYSILN